MITLYLSNKRVIDFGEMTPLIAAMETALEISILKFYGTMWKG
jgi:hypothetical protein